MLVKETLYMNPIKRLN